MRRGCKQGGAARGGAGGGGGRHRSLGGARRGEGGAGPGRQSATGPRPRGRRRPGVRRPGVCTRAPGGGGEPRAARPRPRPASAHAAARPPPPRRTRSLPGARPPRLRPVFLWARQAAGVVQEVRCEDYDAHNRLRLARTPAGWRVIPRTAIYDSIRVPPARRARRRARAASAAPAAPAAPAPDLESHIPSHTIAVPRPPSPPPAEPTPLDSLLAVAELEFHQQRGAVLLDLEEAGAPYAFLPEVEAARDVMSFDLAEPKSAAEMFFEREPPAPDARPEEDAFPADMAGHKDLFETISEAHYLPELGGDHDEALLESLVEKGCEDNQILGQALEKLADLVHSSSDYRGEEDDILLTEGPVADMIDHLEQSLESPGRSSITAAQGLLHLHHIGDHLPLPEHRSDVDPTYMSDEVFEPREPVECPMEAMESVPLPDEVPHMEYDDSAEKKLESDESADVMYTDPVPDTHETYDKTFDDQQAPDQSEMTVLPVPEEPSAEDSNSETCQDMDVKSEMDSNSMDEDQKPIIPEIAIVDFKELEDSSNGVELVATDLSIKHVDKTPKVVASVAETTDAIEDSQSDKSDEQPKDLSLHRRLPTPHASPRRIEIPRAPSRESDAMQSPQPSGIPAVPSSPEIFTMPQTKSKHSQFLESLLSSPSPKMYTSEVTITKQQCEPLNLGKHRKSASPTVTSCSDEIRRNQFGEPQEKRMKINKCSGEASEAKPKKTEKSMQKSIDLPSNIKQLQMLKSREDFNIPDPLLIPKDKMNDIILSPGREIPALLIQRPELRLPEVLSYPSVLQDPQIIVVSLAKLEMLMLNNAESYAMLTEMDTSTPKASSTSTTTCAPATSSVEHTSTTTASPKPKQAPAVDALAGDIDAATSALNQMLWIPYLSQLEAMAACSQNMDFLKALNSTGYNGPNYPDLSQMFNPSARYMAPNGFPMMPPVDYENRLQFAMWQEALNQANANSSGPQRAKSNPSLETQSKEQNSKSSDVQNPYVHSTKSHNQSKSHSAARTSPIAHNYNTNQRAMNHHPFLQGMYPGMNPNMRPNMPLPGLQIPYFHPSMMGSQRSPRMGQQKSPTSPYYQNNNYLQSVKHAETHQRSSSTGSLDCPRPRISVKSLQNLLEPSAAASSSAPMGRRSYPSAAALGRRRDEPEVGSTTPLGEPPAHLPPHPHDPSSFHLWHPLFGNHKAYASPWSWTTVTATGD